MGRKISRWLFYPIANAKVPVPSVKELALLRNIDSSTLSSAKARRTCMGKVDKPICEWHYLIDETFSQDELLILYNRVINEIDNEIWVRLFNDCYFVSNYGRVKVVRNGKTTILKQSLRGRTKKYLSVTLSLKKDNMKNSTHTVHRLVAMAFLERPPYKQYKYVTRVNRSMFNNLPENLVWSDDRVLRRLSSDNKRHKPVVKIDRITGEELDYYSSLSEAGKENFIQYQGIAACARGKQGTCAGYVWKFDN